MANQRIVLAVAVVAGLVACVASQSMNPIECSKNIQTQMSRYQKAMTSAMNKFTSEMGNQGSQMTDMDPMMRDMNRMLEVLMKMTDMQNGFNGAQMMDNYFEIMRLQSSMASNAMRNSLMGGSSSFNAYMGMMSEMMSANMQLMSNMANNCVPNAKALNLQKP